MDRKVELWVEGVVEKIDRFRSSGFDEAVLSRRDWNKLYSLFPESLSKENCLIFELPDGFAVKLWPG